MCLVGRVPPPPYVACKLLIQSYLFDRIGLKIFIIKNLSLKILFLNELARLVDGAFIFFDL
jgi:hypothetical protein